MKKRFQINAEFPQVLAKDHHQTVSLDGYSFPLAAKRGLEQIMRRPGIKGHRHKVIRLTVVASELKVIRLTVVASELNEGEDA